MSHHAKVVAFALLTSLQICAMHQVKTTVSPFLLNEKQIEKYFVQFFGEKKNSPPNKAAYMNMFKMQCIYGGNLTSLILSSSAKQIDDQIYDIGTETRSIYLKKICSVVTFLFTTAQSVGQEGPRTWLLKLKDDTEQWRQFFIHNSTRLTSGSEDTFLKQARGKAKGHIGWHISINPELVKPFVLPFDDNEILVIPDNKDVSYLTVRTGSSSDTGWVNRELEKHFYEKVLFSILHPMSLFNGAVSWFKQYTGGYVKKNGTDYTEYLSQEIPPMVAEILSLYSIEDMPSTMFGIYERFKTELQKEKIDQKTRQEIEKLLHYIKKNFSNLHIRVGKELISNKEWLKANAFFYALLNPHLDKDEIQFKQTEASEKYYHIISKFKLLDDLIYQHNHDPDPNSLDAVFQQALAILKKDFKTTVTTNVTDEKIKHHLLEIITTFNRALMSKTALRNLLELPFFDEDNLKSIQEQLPPLLTATELHVGEEQPPVATATQQQTASQQSSSSGSQPESAKTTSKNSTEAQQPPTTTDQKSGAESQQLASSTQDAKQSSSGSSTLTQSEAKVVTSSTESSKSTQSQDTVEQQKQQQDIWDVKTPSSSSKPPETPKRSSDKSTKPK